MARAERRTACVVDHRTVCSTVVGCPKRSTGNNNFSAPVIAAKLVRYPLLFEAMNPKTRRQLGVRVSYLPAVSFNTSTRILPSE